MGTRSSLAKLSRELYPGLEAIDQNVVSVDDNNVFSGTVTTSEQVYLRGYAATKPSLIQKWPAHTAAGDGAAKTLTIAQLLTGVITADPTADRVFTLPTAALSVDGVVGCAIGDCIDFTVINLGTASADEIITVTAGGGCTLVGSGAVLTANAIDDAFSSGSGLFRLRFTAVTGTDAIVVYRLA